MRIPEVLLSLAIACISCSKMPSGQLQPGMVEVRLRLSASDTKSDVMGMVSSLDAFAFASDGAVLDRLHSTGQSDLSLLVPWGGDVQVYVLANWAGQDLSGVSSLRQFQMLHYTLDQAARIDRSGLKCLMLGSQAGHPGPSGCELQISLSRLVAEVVIEDLSIDLSQMFNARQPFPDTLEEMFDIASELSFDGLFLMNCVYERTLSGDILGWCNRSFNPLSVCLGDEIYDAPVIGRGWNCVDAAPFDFPVSDIFSPSSIICANLLPGRLQYSEAVFSLDELPVRLYCLENPYTNRDDMLSSPQEWAPRVTRLVASFYDDSRAYFFPLDICGTQGCINANTSYIIPSFLITPYSFAHCPSNADTEPSWLNPSVSINSVWADGGNTTERL